MKNITPLLLGIFVCASFGAAVRKTDLITVKPAYPKYTIVKDFGYEYSSENVANYIRAKIKEGYIMKSVEGSNRSTTASTWIVIMEKY